MAALQKHRISYLPNQFFEALDLKIVYSSQNYEAVQWKANFGRFEIDLKVYNCSERSDCDQLPELGKGGLARVYLLQDF